MGQEYTKKRKNQHIKLSERIKIEVGLATNQSIRSIAKQLRRSVSSISVEIKKGWYKGISARGGKSCLAVFVDRKTRYYWLVKMKNKSAEEMLKATVKTFKNYPIKSITYDNGTENMNHLIANKILHCQSYFCRPYCSADKGYIENRNKILRQFLPKKNKLRLDCSTSN